MEEEPRFLADRNLGKLCKLLRTMGIDCSFANTSSPAELYNLAAKESRIILTRKREVPEKISENFIIITDDIPFNQAVEVVRHFRIDPLQKAFTRCIECNVPLVRIGKEEVRGKVPSYIFKTRDEFYMCPSCKRIYWRGTHKDNMRKILEDIKKEAQEP